MTGILGWLEDRLSYKQQAQTLVGLLGAAMIGACAALFGVGHWVGLSRGRKVRK